jgi:hypothetical protein
MDFYLQQINVKTNKLRNIVTAESWTAKEYSTFRN